MSTSRQERGRALWERGAVSELGYGQYQVVSAKGVAVYTVTVAASDPCSCPDFLAGCPRGQDGNCKHIWAVSYFRGEVGEEW